MKFHRIVVILAALALTGCGTMKQQSFNRAVNPEVKTIQVLPMPQANVRLFIFNNVANNFGLLGLLVGEANRNGKETTLQKMVAASDFNQFEMFKTTFTAEMSERGYVLVWPEPLTEKSNASKRDNWMLRKRYGSITGSNAQLDLGITFVGYAAAGNGKSQPYRPTLNMGVRLVSSDGKKVLMQDQLLHHNVTGAATAIVIEPAREYSYPNFDDLKAADQKAIEGLKIAVQASAKALAQQFGDAQPAGKPQ
jgi:hypothetical protein